MTYRYEPRTFRDDRGRGKVVALTRAADELDQHPGQVTTYGEMAAWLRARTLDEKLLSPLAEQIAADESKTIADDEETS